jgi:hypothetical protein
MVTPNKVLELSCSLADIERKAICLPISFTNIQRLLLRYQPDECRYLTEFEVMRLNESHQMLQQWLEKALACFQPYYYVEVSCASYKAIHTLQGILLDYPKYPSAAFPHNRLCFVVLIE